jgi:hypothetical protein
MSNGDVAVETGVVLTVWAAAAADPAFFLGVYVPGYLAGLGLCSLQGTSSTPAARPATTDGCTTGASSTTATTPSITPAGRALDAAAVATARRARQQPVAAGAPLAGRVQPRVAGAPRAALAAAQRLVLFVHERAFRALLTRLPPIHRVTIVGGGLYPRSTLILRRLLPRRP